MEIDSTVYSERRLWASVVLRFFRDLGRPGESLSRFRQRERDDSLAWFESTSTTIGSFKWICQELDLNSTRILRMIRAGTYRVFDNLEILLKRLEQHMDSGHINKKTVAEKTGIPYRMVFNLMAKNQQQSKYAPNLEHYLDQEEAAD